MNLNRSEIPFDLGSGSHPLQDAEATRFGLEEGRSRVVALPGFPLVTPDEQDCPIAAPLADVDRHLLELGGGKPVGAQHIGNPDHIGHPGKVGWQGFEKIVRPHDHIGPVFEFGCDEEERPFDGTRVTRFCSGMRTQRKPPLRDLPSCPGRDPLLENRDKESSGEVIPARNTATDPNPVPQSAGCDHSLRPGHPHGD